MFPPLIIYPEGGITNGTCIIQFKKGAFVGLNSIKPVGITYKSSLIHMSNGSVPFQHHYCLLSCNPYSIIYAKEFPVFKPNDYFFDNHQVPGEEKWETYARVMREIMSKELGLVLSEVSIEDKFDYRKLLFPKGKNHAD